ncbi:MAG: right-handed parallel beta-helix repeat-containing protein [Bacteroidota bacterium]|nr:right-handed parallel beta-helix repeat-containing protein [Bacteroidota bacterium]
MKRMICSMALLGIFQLNGQTIDVTRFGVHPNSFADAMQGVKRAIAACRHKPGAVLVFPAGRYDFWPAKAAQREYYISNTSSEEECPSKTKTIGLLFEQIKRLTVEGNGSLFVFHGKMITWALDHCEDIRLQNISIDFERPTMSEMTLKIVEKDSLIAAIHPDSKFTIINNKLMWYGEGWTLHHYHAILVNPVTGVEKYSTWEPFLNSKAEVIGPNMVVFRGDFSKFEGAPGAVLTIRDPIRDEVGAFINHSRNISLKNINMHYMHGLGIVAQFSKNLFYDSVNIAPAEKSGRVIASFADGMHFSGCRGYIRIENCLLKGFHDDPINVHGTHLQITRILSPTSLLIRFMHPQTYGIRAFFKRDSIAFVHSQTLQIYHYARIARAKLISEREMLVDLTSPIPAGVSIGDCLENITWTPSVIIRHCRFEGTPTRGLLVTTRRPVLIEDNVFFRTGMQAILIADDASSWYESGEVENVIIRNNTFQECGYNAVPNNYIIAIMPENHQLIPGYMVHKNILIENNTFRIYDYPLLTARSTGGLIFKNNKVLRSTFMKTQENREAQISLTACSDVKISGNQGDILVASSGTGTK